MNKIAPDWEVASDLSGYRPVIPWRWIYRKLAEGYGWTPDQVNQLTLYQVHVYTCEEKNLGKPVARDAGDNSNRETRRAERSAAIDRLLLRYTDEAG